MNSKHIFDIAELITRYHYGRLSETEENQLSEWLKQSPRHQKVFDKLKQESYLQEKFMQEQTYDSRQATRNIFIRKNRKQKYIRLWQSVAASLILLIGVSTWLITSQHPENRPIELSASYPVPGSRHAILHLPDGTSLALGPTLADTIVKRDGAKVIVASDNIKYTETEDSTITTYHTLNIPKGGEYLVTLEDGTTVHLNSDSYLRYPTKFNGNRRQVFLSGEAYFDVAKNPEKPFIVQTENISIKVYGTVFNVNTRDARKVQTVLVEGSVGIWTKANKKEYRLSPSQIATYNVEEQKIEIQEVDTRFYTAWQEGLFLFNNVTLEHALEELARWYDIDIFYSNKSLKEQRVSCYMQRFEDITLILNAISQITDARFDLNGKTLTVSDK